MKRLHLIDPRTHRCIKCDGERYELMYVHSDAITTAPNLFTEKVAVKFNAALCNEVPLSDIKP